MPLSTWVPPEIERPRRVAGRGTRHPVYVYAPLSDELAARGERLRDHRVTMGLGLREAADQLGVTAVVLGECERGVRSFDLDDAKRLLITDR